MEQRETRIAVFDLNQTVYKKSSKEEFFKFICYRKNYKLFNVFQLLLFDALKQVKLLNKTEFKENFFHYLDHLPPDKVKEYATEFWSIEWPKYFNQKLLERIESLKKEGVKIIFITGTIHTYVEPLFENILKPDAWFATKVVYKNNSYKIVGKALKDEEKIKKLEEYFGDQDFKVVEAFSDKKEDILGIAEKAYLLKNEKIIPYYKKEK